MKSLSCDVAQNDRVEWDTYWDKCPATVTELMDALEKTGEK